MIPLLSSHNCLIVVIDNIVWINNVISLLHSGPVKHKIKAITAQRMKVGKLRNDLFQRPPPIDCVCELSSFYNNLCSCCALNLYSFYNQIKQTPAGQFCSCLKRDYNVLVNCRSGQRRKSNVKPNIKIRFVANANGERFIFIARQLDTAMSHMAEALLSRNNLCLNANLALLNNKQY